MQPMDTLYTSLPLMTAPRAGASWLQRSRSWLQAAVDTALLSREERFLAEAADLADLECRLRQVERHGPGKDDLLRW
jgi:hypothetical protein